MTERMPWFRCYPEKLLNAMAQMTADQMLVYQIILLRIYETGGPCPDSVEALATRCRLNKRRVFDALDPLFRAGKLTRVGDGIINPFAEGEIRKQREISAVRKIAGQAGALSTNEKRKAIQSEVVGKSQANGRQPLSLSKRDLFSVDSKREEVSEERSSGRGDRVWDFDRFWQHYPHKVGKGQARRAFDTAMKKTPVQFDELMAALDRYIAAKPADRAWCNPATWLNGERWLDEPAKNGGAKNESILDAIERVFGPDENPADQTLREGPVRSLPQGPVR